MEIPELSGGADRSGGLGVGGSNPLTLTDARSEDSRVQKARLFFCLDFCVNLQFSVDRCAARFAECRLHEQLGRSAHAISARGGGGGFGDGGVSVAVPHTSDDGIASRLAACRRWIVLLSVVLRRWPIKTSLALASLMFCCGLTAPYPTHAAPFVNLDFEQSTVVPVGGDPRFIQAAPAFPGWTARLAGFSRSQHRLPRLRRRRGGLDRAL